MKSYISQHSSNKRPDFTSFLVILFYFMTLVLFSYKEGQTLYAKIAAATVVLCFFMKLVLSKRTRMELPTEYQVLLGWFIWSIFSLLGAINQDIAFNKIITLFKMKLQKTTQQPKIPKQT